MAAPTTYCSLIAIILRSMACFFRCFGARDTHPPPRLVSSSNSRDPVVSRSHNLSSLFQSQEREEDAVVVKERDSLVPRAAAATARTEFQNWQLNDEAKFLKACGTLVETPKEIRKSSKKLDDLAEHDLETIKFHSWLTNLSTEPAPIDSPTPSSCIINEQSDIRISVSSLEDGVVESTIATTDPQLNGNSAIDMPKSPGLSACKSEFRNRSVRFESSPQTCIQNKENPEFKGDGSLLNHSPYPTPLNLTDSMQTPGTVFASGNNARIRSQYVYAAMNLSKLVSLGAQENASYDTKASLRGGSVQTDITAGTDLASWLKPPASGGAGNESKYRPVRNQGDMPIHGLVAEHWEEDEDVPCISPKLWDGNGIPNSTTKYKEDQKVCWHATPFEERLEKALSEESFISKRKPGNMKPVIFEDEEERDTATCKLQSFKGSKPLVSC